MKELPKATTDGFKRIFHGEVVFPGDVNYDEVRQIWNAMIDRKPALIARCKSAEDVVQRSISDATRICSSRSAAAATTSRATQFAMTVS